MATTPTLHALLIGICDYPIAHHQLFGCRNDTNLINDYLGVFAKESGLDYRPFLLLDSDASRNGIIKSFDNFKKASDGDTCLIYYSGHGSKSAAPPEFWYESDQMNESIVCHDSRIAGGLDLLDKELSYLIWEATKGKDVHFAAIMDCCFAGTNTRGLTRSRMAEPSFVPKTVEDYLGYSFYKKTEKDGSVLLSPPSGKHVHLAASRDSETAKERDFDGKQHGAFTHAMVQILAENGAQLTYHELMRLVNLRLGQLVTDQHAQLSSVVDEFSQKGFLNGALISSKRSFHVRFTGSSWRLDGGALHGIGYGANLKLEDGTDVIVVDKHPVQVKVKGIEAHDKETVYEAHISWTGRPNIVLGFAEDCEGEGVEVFHTTWIKYGSILLDLSDNPANANYLIHAKDNSFFLTLPGDKVPLFKRSAGVNEASCWQFLANVERVARWVQLLALNNRYSTIGKDEYAIELFHVDTPSLGDESPSTLVGLQVETPVFEYGMEKKGFWANARTPVKG
ncbi:MAG: caspase family protein [Saprospiraceae bacterium]|nr:caspase family protein [Saprospiraceae bacterium]